MRVTIEKCHVSGNLNAHFFFAGLQSLDSLILAHNMITTVPANVFSHLTQLNSLELEGNKISAIDKDAFKGLEGKFFVFSSSPKITLISHREPAISAPGRQPNPHHSQRGPAPVASPSPLRFAQ